jgi:site-specific DNA recombinase
VVCGGADNPLRHRQAPDGERDPDPTGKAGWGTSTLRNLLQNPTYTGTTYGNWRRVVPARRRRSPLQPVACGLTNRPRPPEEWIPVAVPAIIFQEVFDLAQEKLALNRERASRHNTRHHLLGSLVSCGLCRLAATARTSWDGSVLLRVHRPRPDTDIAPLLVPPHASCAAR